MEKDKQESSEQLDKITIHYIKVPDLRTSIATGATGGITANRLINMDFFVERVPIPQSLTHEVNDGKLLQPPLNVYGKEGIVREVHTSLVFSVEAAKEFVKWIERTVNVLEKANKEDK